MHTDQQKRQREVDPDQYGRALDDGGTLPKSSPLPVILLSLLLCIVVAAAGLFIFWPSNGDNGAQMKGTDGTGGASATTKAANVVTGGILHAGSVAVKTYPISHPNVDLMPPIADKQGNIWFGDMSNNRLVRLDTRTGKIADWPLTQNQNGIMNTVLDEQGNVWFAEQSSNSIGRFQPQQQQLQRFQLPTTQGQRLSPQDLFFDAKGMLWFTAVSSGQLGQLDPATGKVRLWSLPQVDGNQLYPYSITIDSQGQIWLGMLTGGVIARFDPATTQFTISKLADPQMEVSALASEQHGQIWFAELQTGKIGKIDVKTRQVTEYQVPSGTQQTDTPLTFSGIAVSAQGEVWIACPNGHTLIRYLPQTKTFTAVKPSIAQSQPYHLTFDTHNHLWLTSSGDASSSYIGEIDPAQVHTINEVQSPLQ
ncbi:hypothetical protein KDH_28970 [Dictyobacter sp. S3.2.2.5]|uniref:SMP-30/Gluconolactonase/LRE-like region domain-containing protein n=1 Tax=Dictyobacter halimunensis TaxID=3026934 RepID=A0ABQ6FP45_9CHLR|nr:hypothetical protein KDH_28970 [Dictyobacter sp. S3.2.2.5]